MTAQEYESAIEYLGDMVDNCNIDAVKQVYAEIIDMIGDVEDQLIARLEVE